MRNSDYKDDQKVFTFINSNSGIDFSDLREFLCTNKLPIRARWVFYFFGVHSKINDYVISKMEDKSCDSYGGYISGEVYWWERYFTNESEEKDNIRQELKEEGKTGTTDEIDRIFYEKACAFVDDMLEGDREMENFNRDREYRKQNWAANDEPYDSDVCGACQESPCMCSDREETSTTNEF